MDPAKFSSELQTWMQESGAVKELRTRLRKEMYDLLLTKKQPKDSKNINVLNDVRSRKGTQFDLALNLLIVEHLMQQGLWYTASVMVCEADFLEEPPEIEVVTTSKKDRNTEKMSEYKRQSPAKMSDKTIEGISKGLFSFSTNNLLDSVCMDYYRTRDVSVMTLILKYLDNNLTELMTEKLNTQETDGESLVQEIVDEKKRRRRRHTLSTTEDSTLDESSKIKSREKKSHRRKKDQQQTSSEEQSIDEKSALLKRLHRQLLDARCEIEALQESKVRLAHLHAITEGQNFTIEEFRKEIRSLKSQQILMGDKFVVESKQSDQQPKFGSLQNFMSKVRSSVEDLGLENEAIDQEFANLL